MVWTTEQVSDCKTACGLVTEIIHEAFGMISRGGKISEYEVQQYIHQRYREEGLVSDGPQIVAFDESASTPHYSPSKKSKRLKPGTLVLIDCWARFKKPTAPFADTTLMGFYGKKVPKKVQEVFELVIKARDACLSKVRQELKNRRMPVGKELDKAARDVIEKAGYGKEFIHTTGHSLGTVSPHGTYGGLNRKHKKELRTDLGYTIEPGIYLKGRFGVRSEIDFLINPSKEVVLLTPLQRKLKML